MSPLSLINNKIDQKDCALKSIKYFKSCKGGRCWCRVDTSVDIGEGKNTGCGYTIGGAIGCSKPGTIRKCKTVVNRQ